MNEKQGQSVLLASGLKLPDQRLGAEQTVDRRGHDSTGKAGSFTHGVTARNPRTLPAVRVLRSSRTGELPRISGPTRTASRKKLPCHFRSMTGNPSRIASAIAGGMQRFQTTRLARRADTRTPDGLSDRCRRPATKSFGPLDRTASNRLRRAGTRPTRNGAAIPSLPADVDCQIRQATMWRRCRCWQTACRAANCSSRWCKTLTARKRWGSPFRRRTCKT